MTKPHVHIAIAGSGFSGLGAAIRLKQSCIDDFLVFERAGDVGGTWRDNSYPGCACDVPSHLYSFSFAPNPSWTRSFSPQPEIQAYLKGCAERFGILPHLRFHHELLEARWNEGEGRWHLETSKGIFTADILIAGVGALSEPSTPHIEGIERFEGKVFHSARWDHEHDLSDRSVAVIGTGASAIQIVPEIQPRVGKLSLFQRTPPWIMPRNDHPLSPRAQALFRALPFSRLLLRWGIYFFRELFVLLFLHPALMRLAQRIALRHLERAVPDPELRKRLTPSYTLGCKRILISDNYLPALTRKNVELVTDPIREVSSNAIVTADGRAHSIDTIILATGFHVTDPPIAHRVFGRGGRTIATAWNGSPKAHLGTTISGFPNFFMLLGPNTGLGHNSIVFMIECQIAHVLAALRFMNKHGAAAIEPKAEAQSAFIGQVDQKMRRTVWMSGGCASWYLDQTGRVSALWPGFTWAFKRRIACFDPKEYLAVPAGPDKLTAPLPNRLLNSTPSRARG